MNHLQKIKKYIKVILLRSGDPVSLPEIQAHLREFDIEASEFDILKVIHNIPSGEYELVLAAIHKTKSDPKERNSKYQAGIFLKRKNHAKISILNLLSNIDEKHISSIQELFTAKEEKCDLHVILEEMEAEDLIRFKTSDHYFVTITNEGRDYLKAFN